MTHPNFDSSPVRRQHLGPAAAVGAAEALEVHAAGSTDGWDEEEAKLGKPGWIDVQCTRDWYMVGAKTIERKLRSTKVRLFTVPVVP